MCDARRRLAREAVDVAEPAHRLGDRGEAGALRVRAGLPVAGDARDHEPRVRLEQLLGAEVPALERAGPEVLGEDVGVLDEREQQRLPLLGAQVERAAALVPRLDGPPERPALVAGLAPVAERVRLARRLDLDDLGAHVAEQPPGERAGEQHPELDRRGCPRAARARAGRSARRPPAGSGSRRRSAPRRRRPRRASRSMRDEHVPRLEHVLPHDQLRRVRVARRRTRRRAAGGTRPRSASARASTSGTSCRRAAARSPARPSRRAGRCRRSRGSRRGRGGSRARGRSGRRRRRAANRSQLARSSSSSASVMRSAARRAACPSSSARSS